MNAAFDRFSATDHAMMARALRLAERGAFTTRPNPMVGCVIARKDKVVGEGYHVRAGEPHAEAFALKMAGDKARGATAYVTLEPCAHTGRTPPCADALVAAGITRVVAAGTDPYAAVDGEGFRKLMAAGVVAEKGLLEAQARELNRGFFSRIERGRPWLRVKLAASLDGRTALADGSSKWISSEAARADVQLWRARAGALLTGSGTALADDPSLTVRLSAPGEALAPLRVVLDTQGRLPATLKLFDTSAPTLVAHALDRTPAYPAHVRALALPRDGEDIDLRALLAQLAQREVNEVQVEAGARLCGALLRQGLVDEVLLYVAPLLLGEAGKPLFAGLGVDSMAARYGLALVDSRQVGPDLRLLLRPQPRTPGRGLMFTGLVQAVGRLAAREPRGGDLRLRVDAGDLPIADLQLGESIAVNGVCLTVVRFDARGFEADASNETLALTTLGSLALDAPLNLERALLPTTRLGGHLVAGHVDGLGRVESIADDGRSQRWRFAVPAALLRYVAAKGSICIDGVSLTVNAVDDRGFDVNLVPHTLAHTAFAATPVAAPVNLEVDLIARYAERLLQGMKP